MIDNRPDKSDTGWSHLFPVEEEYRDCAGTRRAFRIEAERTEHGWMLTAAEQNGLAHGYYFKEFSSTSPAEALDPLRHKIRAALAVKYLDPSPKGPALTHDVMRGTVAYDSETDAIGLVVDGVFISLREFGELLGGYEGWEFEMSLFG